MGDRVVVDQVMNVSLSGMMLLSQYPLEPGQSVKLTLRAFDRRRVELCADVVWAHPSKELPGIEAGVRLSAQPHETFLALEQLLIDLLATPRGRRAAVRFTVTLGAWWRSSADSSQMTPIELTDLSLTGAMVSGEHVPQYGARGLLALDLGDGLNVVAAAVVWRDIHRTPFAAGLMFDRGEQASAFVARVVRALLFVPRAGAGAV